jgi:hypothetical protein
VIQGLQHRELRGGQIADGFPLGKARQDRIGTARQLDKGVEGAPLCAGAFEMSGHNNYFDIEIFGIEIIMDFVIVVKKEFSVALNSLRQI